MTQCTVPSMRKIFFGSRFVFPPKIYPNIFFSKDEEKDCPDDQHGGYVDAARGKEIPHPSRKVEEEEACAAHENDIAPGVPGEPALDLLEDERLFQAVFHTDDRREDHGRYEGDSADPENDAYDVKGGKQ